jgi:hypothetical protein
VGVGWRFGHLRPRGQEPVEAYVSQTGTVEASAARPFARRKGAKLNSYGDFSGSLLERRLLIAALVAGSVAAEAMFDVVTVWLVQREHTAEWVILR